MYYLNYYEKNQIIGHLLLQHSACLKWVKTIPSKVVISRNHALKKNPVSSYISGLYAEHYDAKINVHYPLLFSLVSPENKILAAVGFRPAIHGSLFLEQYLDTSIEECVQVPRSQIVEIGNLAANSRGATILLFTALSAYLNNQGFTQAVVTSTQALEKRFELISLCPRRLAEANPDLLLHKDEHWGSYYETKPHVLVGSVTSGYEFLKTMLNAEYSSSQNNLLVNTIN